MGTQVSFSPLIGRIGSRDTILAFYWSLELEKALLLVAWVIIIAVVNIGQY